MYTKVSLNDGEFKYEFKGIAITAHVALESVDWDIDYDVKMNLTFVVRDFNREDCVPTAVQQEEDYRLNGDN